jgi:REP element-mobilizing transposase RayT
MSHSYISNLLHCVFSTKERRSLITPELHERLYPYTGGIARENKMKLLCGGGMDDHSHLLLSFPKTLAVSKGMQLIKGGSSKWIHETFPQHRNFEWQEGYGAFSIGIADIDRTIDYIKRQPEHHLHRDFKTEFIYFLDRHFVEYDEKYVFD